MEKEKIYISENPISKDEILSLSKNDYRWYKGICENCGNIFETHCYRKSLICKKCKCSLTQKQLYIDNPNLGQERLAKRTASNLKKYGVKNVFQRKNTIDRIKKTKLKKYGDENYNNQEKSKQTCLEKYGVEFSFQSENNKEKSKKTKLERYGNENFVNTKKIIETRRKHFGKNYYDQEKFKKTCLEKYGVEHPLQNRDIQLKLKKKYLYDGINFDSSWELAFWIYHIEKGDSIKRTPIVFKYFYDDVEHTYEPDFELNGSLIEIKGVQFFENKDSSKKMINPFDESKNGLFEAKHQCMLANNVNIITDLSKEIDYVEKKYSKDYLNLFLRNLDFPYLNEDLKDTSDIGLIHHFHKSIYFANVGNKISPFEAWNDKKLIKKSALNRLKYKGKCEPSDILQGFNVAKIAPKVSVFKPSLAEDLIKNYLSDADIIYDPFSGFSGRMLGAFNCDKQYFGFDINEDHVRESNEIIDYKKIGDMCSIEVKDLMNTASKDYSCLRNVCLFTCPPYGGKEHWNKNEIEKSCDEWIELCLEKYKGCKKYLFVVDETKKFKDKIVETLNNQSHFGNSKEYVILIH